MCATKKEEEPYGSEAMEVEDNGVGFDPGQVPQDGQSHIGIINTRRRVKEVGGSLEIQSKIGEGTKVRILLPAK